MKIQYDHQIFTNQLYGGISRYFYELITRFDGIENQANVATLFSNNEYCDDKLNAKVKPFFPNTDFKGKQRILLTLNQQKSNIVIGKGKFDVFHPTYYDDYFIKSLKGKPFVVTFYDMIHEKFSDQFEELKMDVNIYENKKRLLDQSSKVIAISEITKKDIIDIFDVDSSKIEVVHLGSSLQDFTIGDSRIIDEDYILFVGNRGLYKNFNFFVSSIAPLLIDSNLKLICAGGGNFTESEIDLLKQLGVIQLVEVKKIVNDDVLANYYANALFFCFPSLYEGFGIPVLEAFACGCPILLSDGGSLTEVAADAGHYFDPTNSESLFQGASELIQDKTLRQAYKEKGFNRLKAFSWEKTFQEHLNIYESLV